MQPYFLPYAGYFRLFALADLFVVYDCVQFPRRGWVHRNRFLHQSGGLEWLTLPLAKAPQQARIDALQFDTARADVWRNRLHSFRCFATQPALAAQVAALSGTPSTYNTELLKTCCNALSLLFHVEQSSRLNLPPELCGQDRILAICRHFGASEYINAPGGRALYDAEAFAAQGIKLMFLNEYKGSLASIGERLAGTDIATLTAEITTQLECAP